MTADVMRSFGGNVSGDKDTGYHVRAGQGYQGTSFNIEPDATAASYLWAIPAIVGGRVTVEGLNRDSIQGDVSFVDCLSDMGCNVSFQSDGITVEGPAQTAIDVDMNAISDTVQTLAVVALFTKGETVIRNVGHIRHKETDRIGNLAAELRKLGAAVTVKDDGLAITPGNLRGSVINTYGDHRMAMSLALAGLRIEGVEILDPDCTAKTYPRFFEDLVAVVATAQES
jgi:3-phosphoshikimate 1-carboxyvinyltransferase